MGSGGRAATRGLAVYGAVLRRPAVVRTFSASVLARLPIAMAPLGMVLLVEGTAGSYATAGAVTAAFAVGTAAAAPVWGRAMDAAAQVRVLVPGVTASACLLASLALVARAGAPAAALVGIALAAGATFPPFSAAMRGSWRVLLRDPGQRRGGYALDAAAVEALFVLGPLLLSLLLVALPTAGPLLVTAGILLSGGLLYASTAPARLARDRRPADLLAAVNPSAAGGEAADPGVPAPRAPLASLPLLAVMATALTMAVAFGATDTSLAATARSVLGDDARLGVLFAALAGGSTTGGLVYGALGGSRSGRRLLPLALGVFGAGLAAVALVLAAPGRPATAVLLAVLFVVGLVIAPSLIIQQALVDSLAPAERTTEAQAWLSTALTTGAALGTAAAGTVIEAAGVSVSFGCAAAALAAAVATALAAQRPWARATRTAPAGRTGATGGDPRTAVAPALRPE